MDDKIREALEAKVQAMGLVRKPNEERPPGLLKQAVNFAAAATRHVLHGLPVVSDEERERRLSICRGCEFFTAEERCQKCGCAMRKKAAWSLERCPIGKW